MIHEAFAPGARIEARGEDFLVSDVVGNPDGSLIITAEGISELVKGQKFKFDTKIDTDIRPLDPAQTKLIPDTDSGYRRTKLFLETQLRNSTTYSKKITIAHKAAFNLSEYQLDPTIKAFKLPRPRLLIADGVGLGKTIEVGIFLAEMIKRGKGKRIMVLALKSILRQFQQEMWDRFAIPLVRLDSQGIAQIKSELPINKNPFEYYDKTIISIDTLKNNAKFRHHIEKSHWDIIVIDECHTVANISSLRGDLAQFLATRCESLMLTSATPHNGKKESFANLINMIEPTAIPGDGNYSKTDVDKYYVRRFKQHILDDQVRSNFMDREVIPIHAALNKTEEDFLSLQQQIKFDALSTLFEPGDDEGNNNAPKKEKRDLLFSIGLFKAYMSSPMAAIKTLEHRIEKIQENKGNSDLAENNLSLLGELNDKLTEIISHNADSKYEALKNKLIDLGWNGRKADDRIVLFAERIDTIKYLKQRLTHDFGFSENSITEFHGGFTDSEQQEIIEDFGKKDSDIRLLITSDAGSQGVNLHYYCNIMFNYDIPWSLITLEQRNGRIDRYGQNKTPYIYYLIAKSETDGLKTDLHIVENLTRKENEVHNALGDAASVMRLYDVNAEEKKVEENIASQNEDFLLEHSATNDLDLDMLFGGETDITETKIEAQPIEGTFSIYTSDSDYYYNLAEQLKSERLVESNDITFEDNSYMEIRNNKELNRVLYDIPKAAKPAVNDIYRLSLDKNLIQKAIEEARKKKGEWAKFQMLYDLHPVIRYLMTKLEASVDKDVALVARLNRLPGKTAWFVLHGMVANNIGQAVISDFFVIPMRMDGGLHKKPLFFKDFIAEFNLSENLLTQQMDDVSLEKLNSILPDAIEFSKELHMFQVQQKIQHQKELDLAVYQERLDNWHHQATRQLELDFGDKPDYGFFKRRLEDKEREIETIISRSSQYYKDLTSLSQDPYLKVLAVFYND